MDNGRLFGAIFLLLVFVVANTPIEKDNKMNTIYLGPKTKILIGFGLLVAAFLLYTTIVVGWDIAPYYYDIPTQLHKTINLYRYGTPSPELA
jgi:NADH:ubiquinone oxidoreductase subunit 6 (subunit J)